MSDYKYVVLGPPGSGKGTQAEVLAQTLAIPHISTGEMFRAEIASQTKLGVAVEARLKAGKLVSDKVTNQVVAERLDRADAVRGFILDGYPRNIAQAEFLATLAPQVTALLIELPDDEAVKRIAGRRTCSQCGAIYHVQYKPPKVDGVCDACGGNLQQRNDETEEVVVARLALYHTETEPIIAFYRGQGKLVVIDGLSSIAEVTTAIRRVLNL